MLTFGSICREGGEEKVKKKTRLCKKEERAVKVNKKRYVPPRIHDFEKLKADGWTIGFPR